jgi:hypothetical protein
MKSTTNTTDKQAVRALRISSLEIAEWFANYTNQHEDWEQASRILSDLADNIVTPSCLRQLSELFLEVADSAEKLATDDEHEAHATESLCELVSENLSTRYDKFIGRG